MNSFYEHHRDNIHWHYRCFDRILLNGSYDAVAHACGAHPTSLYRLLRAPAAVGVFHESDNKDYDISDYLHINPDFGTMQDFRRFMQEARRKSCG